MAQFVAVFCFGVDCTVWHTATQKNRAADPSFFLEIDPTIPPPQLHKPTTTTQTQRLLTQALMDANTYEEMEAEESRVLRKAAETGNAGEEDVEYGAQVRVRLCVLCVGVGVWVCWVVVEVVVGIETLTYTRYTHPPQAAAATTVRRTAGSIAALSGAQGISYMEYTTGSGGGGGGGAGRKRKGKG